MTISEYLKEVNLLYKSGSATEHSYRGYVTQLIQSLVPAVNVTNEPQRIACGAPDYIITRKGIPIGFIEAKDVGVDLSNRIHKEQFDRYKASLNNLVITDYLTFQFYVDGVLATTLAIGHISNGRIMAQPENHDSFTRRIVEFCSYTGQTITSSQKLAKLMAAKARLLADVIELALSVEQDTSTGNLFEEANNSLRDQFESFKTVLIHDITHESFSDMYAQTIAYGMFAARLNDTTLENFTRQEAADLVPKTNPFLRRLFQYIAGYDLDDRIKWIVDALADVFRATNVAELMKDFGKAEQKQDPIIHFYETFLSEYDPSLRKSRGVWYTPHPVVNFIVRAIDDILKDEFGLPDGLADTSKVKIKVNVLGKMVEREVHRVQFLDPATGTATFIAEIITQVHKKFDGQQGLWSNYVEEHLIPRLNGFEILMASYAMAHLKLELLLKETGYQPIKEQRFRIYLTNSLEEHHPDTGTLFASWLSHEANEANLIKRDTPVMVVLGNPPYSVSSSNKGEWIESKISDYKKDLNERKINLDDDYIKFIRYGEYLVEKNGEGILAYISNNSFIDGITHRQMRKHLLETFDKIYILDLHGNAKKKETVPDGGKDENVFDIQQGVSINLFIKTNKKKKGELGQVYHYDLFGRRESKYSALININLTTISYSKIDSKEPYFFFVPRDFSTLSFYSKGFGINEFFINYNSGIQTKRDELTIHFCKDEIERVVTDFKNLSETELTSKYNLKNTSGWTVNNAKNDLVNNIGNYFPIHYRPFDVRFIYMTNKSGGFIGRPRLETMKHMIREGNYGLITVRQQSTFDFQHVLITDAIIESGSISLQTKEWGYIFPLYLYSDADDNQALDSWLSRMPNLNMTIVNQIAESLNLLFTPEKEPTEGTFAPIDLLDYIYAVLHSPTYREKYKEFLKIDFPRVPYPKVVETFWKLVKLGGDLRQIHLLESPVVNNLITQYPVGGSNHVERITYEDQRVYINPEQYFANVPQVAWEFYIGGYQPAQKWLKDRKGRTLLFDDILHYQKIIVALAETDRIMKEIDKINIE
jgi:predicted helicase